MEKKIEDYAPLYMGCNISTREEQFNSPGLKLIGISDMGFQVRDEGIKLSYYVSPNDCKLILRPLSDMTDEEKKVIDWDMAGSMDHHCSRALIDNDYYALDIREYPQIFLYLLSKGFDLFNLIESKLATTK